MSATRRSSGSYAKGGHDVTVMEDIYKLSLQEVDRIRPKHLALDT